jgi:hypothetical protein
MSTCMPQGGLSTFTRLARKQRSDTRLLSQCLHATNDYKLSESLNMRPSSIYIIPGECHTLPECRRGHAKSRRRVRRPIQVSSRSSRSVYSVRCGDSPRVWSGMSGKRERVGDTLPLPSTQSCTGTGHESTMVDSTRKCPEDPTTAEVHVTIGQARASLGCVAHAPLEKVPGWCLAPSAPGSYLQ